MVIPVADNRNIRFYVEIEAEIQSLFRERKQQSQAQARGLVFWPQQKIVASMQHQLHTGLSTTTSRTSLFAFCGLQRFWTK